MGKVKTKDTEKEAQKAQEKAQKEADRLARIEEAKAKSKGKEPKESVIASKAKQSSESEIATSQARRNDKSEEAKKVSKYAAKKAKAGVSQRSENYKKALAQVDKSKQYSLKDALALLDKTHLAKFDETVELHINTLTAGLSGQVTLPHGTGKTVRVAIIAPSKDAKAADELLKEVETGKINFDILVATPDAMPKLAKVAKILGPKGLMPNPKNGTITINPEAVAKQYERGQMYYKTEAKMPVLHVSVGKLSFGTEKLVENIEAFLKAVKSENVKKVILKSTMSPAIRLQVK